MANTSRTYLQRCSLDTGLEAPVTNTGVTTSPDYIVHATLVGPPTGDETVGTDLGTPAGSLRINRVGLSPNYYTATNVNLAIFPTQWQAGWTVVMWVKHIATQEVATWSIVIPTGTTTINIQTPIQVIPPASVVNYTLTVTSTPTGQPIYKDNVDTGEVTPHTFDPGVAGTYKVVNPLYTWVPSETVVPALTENTTIDFQGTLIPVDSWVYNLEVVGPIGYTVTGPGAYSGAMNQTFNCGPNATDINDLVGAWTASAAPAGWHWVVNPINVTAGMFSAGKSTANLKAIQGSRTNGAKTNYVYNATITFVLEADPDTWTYNLIVNGPAGKTVTGPGSYAGPVNQVYTCTTAINDLLGDWTISAADAGYHWVMNPITVVPADFVGAKVDHEFNATITFVQEADTYDFPEGDTVQIPGAVAGNTIQFTDGNANLIGGPYTPTPPLNPLFIFGFGQPLTLVGAGPWTFTLTTTYEWIWIPGHGVWVGPGSVTITILPTKDEDIEIQYGSGGDPTLPVELSYFGATLTAQNFVNLTWVSQSETGLLGYRVYRNETDNQASAVSITPSMIPATNTSTTQSYNIVDSEVAIGSTYWYWLEAVDMGHSTFNGPVSVLVQGEVPPVLPEYTTMRNAYPNPFRANSNTTIEVSVKAGEAGTVSVYNILGQVVKTYSVKEGPNSLNWNGKDSKGNVCGSGIYFYKLSTPSMNQTKKMVIVK